MIIGGRASSLIVLIIAWVIASYYLYEVKKGKTREIRKVAGLDAIDESIGRAAEMGRPMLASTSYDSLASPETLPVLSGIAIIRYLASQTAKLGIPLLLPIGPSDVLALADQNYREGCFEAGVPQAYNPRNVIYVTEEQWAYTSGVLDLIDSKRPGACVFIARFHAEALHLGLAARRVGALIIGGTPHWGMTAFFAVSADYTLLGDEIYAAAAYVSKDPMMISSLTTADVLKWISAALVLIGSILLTLGSKIVINLLSM